MEDKKTKSVKKTFTEAEVNQILANQEDAFNRAMETDSRVRFRAQCIIEVIKNHDVLSKEFVDKAANELYEFLYPKIEDDGKSE